MWVRYDLLHSIKYYPVLVPFTSYKKNESSFTLVVKSPAQPAAQNPNLKNAQIKRTLTRMYVPNRILKWRCVIPTIHRYPSAASQGVLVAAEAGPRRSRNQARHPAWLNIPSSVPNVVSHSNDDFWRLDKILYCTWIRTQLASSSSLGIPIGMTPLHGTVLPGARNREKSMMRSTTCIHQTPGLFQTRSQALSINNI